MQQPGSRARTTLKGLAATTLGWHAIGLLRRPGALILMYHRIEPSGSVFPGLDVSAFHAQMRWLAAHCTPISPDRLHDAVYTGRSTRPPVLVTFDDGYLSYREQAYPILREFGIPALLFLATAYIDEPTRVFWWDALGAAVAHTRCQQVQPPWAEGATSSLQLPAQRQRFLATAKEHLKTLPDTRREVEVIELLDRLGASNSLRSRARQMLSWDDVRAILDITHVGAHSHTHPILSLLTDEELESEVATCRARIREATGLTPRWFAYPNGRTRDFDERTQTALGRHGFDVAFTTVEGVAGVDVDWMAVPRFAGVRTPSELAWRLSVRAHR